MSDGQSIIILNRDTVATMVPAGNRLVLQQGTEVLIVQNKGDNYTVEVYGNLAMISGADADALGKTATDLLAKMPADASLEDKAWYLMRSVFDPEIPVNIVELGLIYNVSFTKDKHDLLHANITMTLTAPGCGMGPVIASEVETKLLLIDEVDQVCVSLVFDPPWHQDMMSESAKLELGML